jgi:putative PIN family toxin of toxin-antitoxin system
LIIVLDTNVWISGLQFAKSYGTPTRALEKAMSRDVIATCPEMEEEILRVLTEKFRWEPSRALAMMDTVLARAIRVRLRGTVEACRDPKDDMFLECAVRAGAELLIAGDKDLLVLGSFEGVRIVTPSAYLNAEGDREASLNQLAAGLPQTSKGPAFRRARSRGLEGISELVAG